ncbi:MAG: siroheme decarboxylase subunit beta [Planctomycetota bacterium]|jgi:heme b synthase
MNHPADPSSAKQHVPRLIAWEVTRSCMLACRHCRASAQPKPYPDELSTDECFRLLDNIASSAKPIIILTAGEPMLRRDIYEIATRASQLDLRVVMAPCGALIDDESAARIVQSGIRHISISLDGATAESHDEFRGVPGAFAAALRGVEAAKRAGLGFQINTTVTKHNLNELPAILELAVKLGASVFNPFLLVPTGRGSELTDQEISPEQYEQTLGWLATQQARDDIGIRVTCAPHYQRIMRQLGSYRSGRHAVKGCMGGQSFAFISHTGKVQICGFLDVECGDVREENFDFRKIWETSDLFLQMRDLRSYRGRCGYCEFARVCGGCRARAYAVTGDYFCEEPFCTYVPKRKPGNEKQGEMPDPAELDELDELDEKILSLIQTDFPVSLHPFNVLGERLETGADEILERIARLRSAGVIRRLGAVFDSRSLGYASTLIAGRIPPDRLEEVAEIINRLPGVTHNYRREHAYNLWFTLTGRSERELSGIIDDLKRQTGIEEFFSLPALGVYKIRVNFQVGGKKCDSLVGPNRPIDPKSTKGVELDDDQKQLVRFLQEDIPAVANPFEELARQLNWSAERVVSQIEEWVAVGVIRRFGAVVRHRRLGFTANGMVVFNVPPDRIDDVGAQIAKRPEVSHCYHRPSPPAFPYNLYAMFHGRSVDQVRSIVTQLADDLALSEYEVLFSTAEYEKTSMKYFLEPGGP